MLQQQVSAAPRIVERPSQRMAVVETVGDPDVMGGRAVGELYDGLARSGLKPGLLCARWPNAATAPRAEWIARWAIPVPDHTPELDGDIVLETWYGGLTAEIVHKGPFGEDEIATVRRLHRFIFDCGYEIDGPPEEEYLTQPGDDPRRTVIRYEIRQHH
jgi:hypothetical protein